MQDYATDYQKENHVRPSTATHDSSKRSSLFPENVNKKFSLCNRAFEKYFLSRLPRGTQVGNPMVYGAEKLSYCY